LELVSKRKFGRKDEDERRKWEKKEKEKERGKKERVEMTFFGRREQILESSGVS
jgi:hypothetical protein